MQVDPYLKLVEDVRLQAVCVQSDMDSIIYGSKEDDAAASKSLSEIELDDLDLKETVISHFMTKFEKLSEVIYQFLIISLLWSANFPSSIYSDNYIQLEMINSYTIRGWVKGWFLWF